MQPSEIQRALAAAMSAASGLGLVVDDAIVLHNSNKLTVRLLPCDLVARVAPITHQVARFEIGLAQRLAESESPVAVPDPEQSRASVSVMASSSRCGPTTSRTCPGRSHQSTTRMRLSDCMPAWPSSMSGRRTSPIEWKRLSTLWRPLTSLRIFLRRIGSFSSLRYGAKDKRSSTVALPSSCCTASRTQATSSARSPDCCSSISRRVAVDWLSSTSPMSQKK
jgi:hypothetical protein